MSLINQKLKPFNVHAFKQGKFIKVTDENLQGRWSVIMFYPADFTFVCPTELEDLQDHYEKFQEIGVDIYSASTDSHFAHKVWHETSDAIRKIQYTMLADPTGKLAKDFDVYIEEDGMALRGTFLINPEGQIKLFEVHDNGIGRDASELLRKVKAAQYVATHDGEVCPAKWKEGEKTLIPSVELVGNI